MARCHGGQAADWQSLVEEPCGPAIRSAGAGRLRLHEDNAAACLAGLAGDDCSFETHVPGTNPCRNLLIGTVPVGQACSQLGLWTNYVDQDCAAGAYCDDPGTACGGQCRAKAELGAPCFDGDRSTGCLPGLACDFSVEAPVCTVPAAEGEACTANGCRPDLYCADATESTLGTCRQPKTEGPCEWVGECASFFMCREDASGQGSCVPEKPIGAACTFGLEECSGQCSPQGLCEVVATEGQRCGSVEDPLTFQGEYLLCAAGLFCNPATDDSFEGICSRTLALGTPCPGAGTCTVGDRVTYCDEETLTCMSCD